jgi:hypothetical protein
MVQTKGPKAVLCRGGAWRRPNWQSTAVKATRASGTLWNYLVSFAAQYAGFDGAISRCAIAAAAPGARRRSSRARCCPIATVERHREKRWLPVCCFFHSVFWPQTYTSPDLAFNCPEETLYCLGRTKHSRTTACTASSQANPPYSTTGWSGLSTAASKVQRASLPHYCTVLHFSCQG